MDKKPIYVKVDEYKEVLELLDKIKEKVDSARKVLAKIEDIKEKEDTELESWKDDIEEVDKKVNNVSHMLTEPEM